MCGSHAQFVHTQAPSYALTPRSRPGPARVGTTGDRTAAARVRSARQTGATAGADFTLWVLLAWIVRDHFWLLLLGAIAIVLPAALAAEWTYRCSAWTNDGTARCRRLRAGFMQRCHSHRRATITQYDVAAAAAAIIAAINALILMAVFLR